MHPSETNLRILIVEDDQRMLDLLCRGLRNFGHTAMPASDGICGLELATVFEFDVVVLDVGLPKRDGLEVARTLREMSKSVPILMLTARDAEDDIIRGLESGADDYLLKPFSFPELVARLHALVRTYRRPHEPRGFSLDATRLAATRGESVIRLTRSEYLLLCVLHHQKGTAISRDVLMEAIWPDQNGMKGNALDVLVNALRTKLDGPFPDKMVETVRGFGYRLNVDASVAAGTFVSSLAVEGHHSPQGPAT